MFGVPEADELFGMSNAHEMASFLGLVRVM